MSGTALKAVVFDLDNTLLDFISMKEKAIEAVIAAGKALAAAFEEREPVADGSVTITNNPDAKNRPGVNPGPRTDVLKEE